MNEEILFQEKANKNGVDEKKRLARKRAANAGVVTRWSREVDDLCNKFESCDITSDERVSISSALKGIKRALELKAQDVQKMDDELENMCEEDEVELAVERSCNFSLLVCNVISKVETSLSRKLECNKESTNSELNVTHSQHTIHLPKLKVPTFEGSLLSWPNFKATFDALIHDNNKLNGIEKFSYLNNSLSGNAAITVAGFPLCNEGYIMAYDALNKRYGDHETLVSEFINCLRLIESVSRVKDIKKLRSFYEEVLKYFRALTFLHVDMKQYSSMLCRCIIEKLPEDISCEISRRTSSSIWDVEETMMLLDNEIKAREKFSSLILKKDTKFDTSQVSSDKSYTASYLIANSSSCVFCNSQHNSNACKKHMTVNDRRKVLLSNGLCLLCFESGHFFSACTSKVTCKRCNKTHNTLLCYSSNRKIAKSQLQEKTNVSESSAMLLGNTFLQHNILLGTAKIDVCRNSEEGFAHSRLLFDSGSHLSYITLELAKHLKLNVIKNVSLNVNSFGGISTGSRNTSLYGCFLNTKDGLQYVELLGIEKICNPLHNNFSKSDIFCYYPQLKDYDLAETFDDKVMPIDILIGGNIFPLLISHRMISINKNLFATLTKFGWILTGSLHESSHYLPTLSLLSNVQQEKDDKTLENAVQKFWEFESLGIMQNDNEEVQTFFSDTTLHKNRLSIRLPWKEQHSLDSHYVLAKNRLLSNYKRLKKQNKIEEYNAIINEQIKTGVLEAVDSQCDGFVHFIPHHAIIKEDSLHTKMRIVLDGSAKMAKNEMSLNDSLYSGPNLINNLFSILLRFRIGKYGVIADLEKAFLQVEIHVTDRNALRILWFSDVNNINSIVQLRYTRLPFGLVSSPYLLNESIRFLLSNSEKSNVFINKISENIYVDNLVTTVDTVIEGCQLYECTNDVFKTASFNMRDWITNNSSLQSTFESDNNLMLNKTYKVLGLMWDVSNDSFFFLLSWLNEYNSAILTKRLLLSIIARFYDPLGFLSPYTIRLRVLLQRMWSLGCKWDVPVPEDFLSLFKGFLLEIKSQKNLVVPRCVCLSVVNSMDVLVPYVIHVFCDASATAYSTAVYLFVENSSYGGLLCAKVKLCPIKGLTIPKAELLGALLAARLSSNVLKSLKHLDIKSIYFWSDSIVVLNWIKNESKINTLFIQNRVKEIRSLTNLLDWRFCPGTENPADLCTRGIRLRILTESHLWWKGPLWLPNIMLWPSEPKNTICNTIVTINANVIVRENGVLNELICVNNYSSLNKLLRVTAYVLMFIRKARKNRIDSFVLVLLEAELLWIKAIQNQYLNEEINYLKSNKTAKVSKRCLNSVCQLNLVLDEDDLLRCVGRICLNTKLPIDTTRPYLLPYDNHFSKLVIENYHLKNFHGSVRQTLSDLRSKFWILKGRKFVKVVLQKCVKCKRFSNKKYFIPDSPLLPVSRVSASECFTSVGIDFAGPLLVSNSNKMGKAYICLFTCSSSRAVHLELAASLSKSDFLLCFRRFVARRGAPSVIYTDNGTNFHASVKEVKMLVNELRESTDQLLLTWNFSTPLAPWWGGFWERMVGCVKRCLRRSLGKILLCSDELQTLLTEIEFTVNNRPLSFYTLEKDGIDILTPSHLLHGKKLNVSNGRIATFQANDGASTSNYCRKRFKYINERLNVFWRQWSSEYLTQLREHHIYQKRTSTASTSLIPCVGDIVFVKEENMPRLSWKLGRISKLIRGRDQLIRSVELITYSGTQKRIIRRPLQLIIPLEI